MINQFEQSIVEAWNKGHTIILPSSHGVTFWQRRLLQLTQGGAIRRSRVISWASFKRKYLMPNGEFQEITPALRLLFVSSLIQKVPLGKLFPNGSSSRGGSTELDYLTRLLPHLPRLIEKLSVQGDSPFLKPWEFISSQYQEFLEDVSCVEPSWTPFYSDQLSIYQCDERFTLFMPEVLRDFDSLYPIIEKSQITFDLWSGDQISEDVHLTVYQSTHGRVELNWVVGKIGELLNNGTPIEDIVVTLPQYNDWKDELSEACDILGVPLSFQQPQQLSSLSFCRVLSILQGCVDKDFHIQELEKLFFFHAIPWKDVELYRYLVRELRGAGVISASFDGDNSYAWEQPLKVRLRDGDFFESSNDMEVGVEKLKRFFSSAKELVRSKTVSQLVENLDRWVLATFTTKGIEDSDNSEDKDHGRTFLAPYRQSVLEVVQSLEDAVACPSTYIEKGLAISPYRMLLKLLQDEVVPLPFASGVKVFPYGESLGITPRYHFIPGASQGVLGTVVQDSLLATFGGVEDSEVSYAERVATLYMSGGDNLYFSSSHRTFSGDEILYLPLAKYQEPIPALQYDDQLRLEQTHWSHNAKNIPLVSSPLLSKGLAYAQDVGLRSSGLNITKDIIPQGDLFQAISKRIPHHEGSYKLSASTIDAYNRCGFFYLFQRVLRLQEPDQPLDLRMANVEGKILHRAVELIFSYGREQNLTYKELAEDPHIESRIAAGITQSVDEIRQGNIPNYLRREIGIRGVDTVRQAIDFFGTEFGEYTPHFIEESLSSVLDTGEGSVVLMGFVDNVSLRDNDAVIVDYKRSASSVSSTISIHRDGPEGSVQIPMYLLLFEDSNTYSDIGDIAGCGYYIFVDTAYKKVVGEKLRLRGDLPVDSDYGDSTSLQVGRLKGRLVGLIRHMIGALQSGDFRVNSAHPEEMIPEKNCERCQLRSLCRTRYVVE